RRRRMRRRLGTIGGGRRGRRSVRLGAGFVRFAAVIGLVEAGAFEDEGRPSAEEAPKLRLLAHGALLQRLVGKRLKFIELMLAGVADVFIGGHGYFLRLAATRQRSADRGIQTAW